MTADQPPRPEVSADPDNRPAWGALIWAWARAHIKLLLVAGLAIVIAAVLYNLRSTDTERTDRDPIADASTSAPPTTQSASGLGTDADRRPSQQHQDQAIEVARGFATEFATPGIDHQDWWSRVTRWTSPHLAGQFASTDWNRIPSGHLSALRPQAAGATVADIVVTYDTGLQVAIRLELDSKWQVTTVVPMRTAY